MYWFTAFVGLVSLAAPFLFNFYSNIAELWTSLIFGTVLIVVSLLEAVVEDKQSWEYWVAGGAGVVAILAPFILGFSAAAIWTLVIVGVITLIASILRLSSGRAQLR